MATLEKGQTVRCIRWLFNFLNTEATLLFTTDSVSAHKSRYIMYYLVLTCPGDPGTGPSRPVDLCDAPTLRDLNFEKPAHSALPQGGIAGGTADEHVGMSHVWVGPPKPDI